LSNFSPCPSLASDRSLAIFDLAHPRYCSFMLGLPRPKPSHQQIFPDGFLWFFFSFFRLALARFSLPDNCLNCWSRGGPSRALLTSGLQACSRLILRRVDLPDGAGCLVNYGAFCPKRLSRVPAAGVSAKVLFIVSQAQTPKV